MIMTWWQTKKSRQFTSSFWWNQVFLENTLQKFHKRYQQMNEFVIYSVRKDRLQLRKNKDMKTVSSWHQYGRIIARKLTNYYITECSILITLPKFNNCNLMSKRFLESDALNWYNFVVVIYWPFSVLNQSHYFSTQNWIIFFTMVIKTCMSFRNSADSIWSQ